MKEKEEQGEDHGGSDCADDDAAEIMASVHARLYVATDHSKRHTSDCHVRLGRRFGLDDPVYWVSLAVAAIYLARVLLFPDTWRVVGQVVKHGRR